MPLTAAGCNVNGDSQYAIEAAPWLSKLDALAALRPGWNRYDAPPPSQSAIANARSFLMAMIQNGQDPTRVAPSAVGGVGVTRRCKDRMAYVEFYNDGSVCLLLTDDHSDGHTQKVEPDENGFRRLLSEMKVYLDHG